MGAHDNLLIGVFGSSTTPEGSRAWRQAYALGRDLAAARFGIATGGYGGTMEAVSCGAAAARTGVPIIGVTAPTLFPRRAGANRHVTLEFRAHSLAERIGLLLQHSSALVALPGSLGTLTELLMAWNDAFLASPELLKPVFAVGPTWATVVPALGRWLDADIGLITLVAEPEQVVPSLEHHLRS